LGEPEFVNAARLPALRRLIRANGELQRLHRTWLGEDMGELSAM
jgi:hypothetical protein